MTEKRFHTGFLRLVAKIFVSAGAIGSLYLMFNAGRNQKSILLIAFFMAWILSPFAGFFIIDKYSRRWTGIARAFFYWLIIIITIGSLAAYSGAFNTPTTKNAFVFIVTPLISWVLIAIVILIARGRSR